MRIAITVTALGLLALGGACSHLEREIAIEGELKPYKAATWSGKMSRGEYIVWEQRIRESYTKDFRETYYLPSPFDSFPKSTRQVKWFYNWPVGDLYTTPSGPENRPTPPLWYGAPAGSGQPASAIRPPLAPTPGDTIYRPSPVRPPLLPTWYQDGAPESSPRPIPVRQNMTSPGDGTLYRPSPNRPIIEPPWYQGTTSGRPVGSPAAVPPGASATPAATVRPTPILTPVATATADFEHPDYRDPITGQPLTEEQKRRLRQRGETTYDAEGIADVHVYDQSTGNP